MKIKKILLISIILTGFYLPCFAQMSDSKQDGFELKQELDNIKQELEKRGKPVAQFNTSSQLEQRISQLAKELELANSKILSLEEQLAQKNKEYAKNITASKGTASKDKQLLELNTRITALQEKLVRYERSPTSISLQPVGFAAITENSDVNKQISSSNDTIIEQTKQLSKAYNEIEKLKKTSGVSNKVVDDIIIQAEKLHVQGKTQEAIALYEVLDRLDIKKARVYQNLALIYQGLGMSLEAKKQYEKLYALFPDLKTN